MATLYEMTAMARELYELLQEDEIPKEAFLDTLEGIGADEKIESYCKIIRQLEADRDAFKLEKQRFTDKQLHTEKNIERMKKSLLNFLNASGQKKISAGLFTVSKSTSQAVNITDESLIPKEFLKPQPPKIDKIAIKNAIKGGVDVIGAEVVINENVRIK